MRNTTLIKRIIAAAMATAAIIATATVIGVLFNLEQQSSLEYSETFSGYISEAKYSSREDTARAFVNEQLNGAAASPKYSDVKVLGEIPQAEIEKLNSDSPTARIAEAKITSGEYCEITYNVSDKQRKIKADILRNDSGAFSYRVRLPENGEQPTKAYMDSVLDGNKYLNCTSRSRISATLLSTYVTYMQTIYFADDKIYFQQELPGLINELYLRESNERLIAFLKNPMGDDDNFYTVSEINAMLSKDGYELNDIYLIRGGDQVNIEDLHGTSDVTKFAFMMPIDCSYFVKTGYGFAMTDDKFKAVCVALAGKEFAEEFNTFWHDYMVNFHADYYVTDGRLSRISLTLQMIYENDLFSMTVVTDYFNFGKTEVTIPHD